MFFISKMKRKRAEQIIQSFFKQFCGVFHDASFEEKYKVLSFVEAKIFAKEFMLQTFSDTWFVNISLLIEQLTITFQSLRIWKSMWANKQCTFRFFWWLTLFTLIISSIEFWRTLYCINHIILHFSRSQDDKYRGWSKL